jgi:hypothetical protein
MNQAEKQKVSSLSHAPLTVECFIVSRGWQVDQAQLTKALAKLDGVNFVRIQVANTMNRVLENIRPNNDVVLIHIGTQEISEACRSINSDDSIPGREISLFYNTVKANKKLENNKQRSKILFFLTFSVKFLFFTRKIVLPLKFNTSSTLPFL